ncbi:peptide/nickel transport system substrate-binding protein [Paenibacillus phyllosphaerae]|uniref:Peptide/nickel transport system substrate-binding protein n=1 Tax=Paenibacillus phyllosphaerae TaxID=274593 RepID=A0A7W5FQB3_9BACL|nr:ABC transporter substrate-binding protein [Paenibacillus phyllosphaerae]MBB3113276.1 peptide/nickel transport system substrate-binding protein [Paenibacillus phyllosphaerae]
MKKPNKVTICLTIMALAGTLLAGCSGNNNNGGNTTTNTTEPANTTTNTPTTEDTTAPDPNTPVDGGNLVISSFSDIISVNPIYVSDTASGDIGSFLYANLYDYNRGGDIVAEPWSLAAELPAVSEDGLTYTIKLKVEAKWNDGTPVTADDVIFTFDTIRNPESASPGISSYDKIDTMTKIDAQTVAIKLKQIYSPFLYSLPVAIAPAHVLKDVPLPELQKNPYGSDPAKTVTNGPWKWTEWKNGQYITLDADPNYWGSKKPHIQKITYKIYADQNTEIQALIKGDVDLTQAVPLPMLETVKANEGLNVILAPGPQYEYLAFNFKDDNFASKVSPFKGMKTRQAVAYAINRQGMVDNILKGTGTPLNAPFLPGTWADPGDAATAYNYDAEKAKALLAEDGWVAGSDGILAKDGVKFSFELQYNAGNSRREQVAAVIQQNLKDVGIEVKTKAIDFAAWIDQNVTPGKFEAILLSWSLNSPDPSSNESIFSSAYFPPAGQNVGWYKNEKLDKLWIDGYSTADQAKRKEIYAEAGKEISTDLPYVFLYQYGLPEAHKKTIKYAEEDRPESSLAYGYFFHAINWWIAAE